MNVLVRDVSSCLMVSACLVSVSVGFPLKIRLESVKMRSACCKAILHVNLRLAHVTRCCASLADFCRIFDK